MLIVATFAQGAANLHLFHACSAGPSRCLFPGLALQLLSADEFPLRLEWAAPMSGIWILGQQQQKTNKGQLEPWGWQGRRWR